MIAGAKQPPLQIVRILPAPPEEAFEAWTNGDSLKQWMCPGSTFVPIVELEARVGGRFRIVMRDQGGDYIHTGQYREIRPPERLVFTWVSATTRGKPTLVTIEFRPHGAEETEMVLMHEQLPDEDSFSKHQRGWGQIATKLATHLRKEDRHA